MEFIRVEFTAKVLRLDYLGLVLLVCCIIIYRRIILG